MRKQLSRAALALVLTLSSVGALRAQQAPVPAARVSIASIDALNKAAAELGIPLPDIAKTTEGMPFFGPGAVVTDKPVGLVILSSDALPALQGPGAPNTMIFAVPVNEGKSTPESLAATGAKPVEGSPSVLKLDTFNLRRIPNYLLIQMGTPMGLAELPDVPFAQDYATPGNLAVFTLNLATVRKMAPEGYKQFMETVRSNAGKPADAAEKAGQDFVYNAIDSLEKFTLAVAQDEQSLHLKTWISPMQINGKPAEMPRPVFPKSVIAQMHIVYPNPQAAAWMSRLMDSLPNEVFKDIKPEDLAKGKAAIEKLSHLIVGGNAVSMAVGMKDNKPVFYIVNQLDAALDPATEIKGNLEPLVANSQSGTHEFSSYDAGGKTVTRVVATSKADNSKVVFDTVASGKTIYVTISPDDGKYVQELADAGMGASSSLLCAGSLNLGAALDVAGPALRLPPDAAESLKKSLAGQGITWTVQGSDSNYLFVDVAIPKALVKELAKFAGVTSTSPANMNP